MNFYITDFQSAGALTLLYLWMEVFTNCSSRPGDPEHQPRKVGSVRSRFERNAVRVCGNWSEQLSSKGKIYFYNCITEVSQWQKPSEWSLPDLEQDEIVRLFGNRDTMDGNVLKRPRILGSMTASLGKEGSANRSSPKRPKTCENTDGDKRLLNENRTRCLPHNAYNYPKNGPTVPQRNRDSPTLDGIGSHYVAQYSGAPGLYSKKDQPNIFSRPIPPDDMEISPNSSPLSDGSSPLDASHPRSPRRIRCRPGAASRGSKRSICEDIKNTTGMRSSDGYIKSGTSSNALRQLLDVIRDSIDGLVDPSPCSTSGQKAFRESSSANGLSRNQVSEFNAKKMHIDPSVFKNHNVESPVVKNKYDDSPKGIRVTPNEFNSKPYLHSPAIESIQSQLSASSTQDRVSTQDKSMSGLVSTLSTLVNLIGTRHSNSQSSGNEGKSRTSLQHFTTASISTYRHPFTRPYPLQQTPQLRFANQQPTFSPITTSPANNAASSSGGSSGSTLNSSTGISVYSHQVDDHVSGSDRLAGLPNFRVLSNTSTCELASPSNVRTSLSPSEHSGVINRDPRLLNSCKDPTHAPFYDEEGQKFNPVETLNPGKEHLRLDDKEHSNRLINRLSIATESSPSSSGISCLKPVSAPPYAECSPVSSHSSATNKPGTCSGALLSREPLSYFTDNKRCCPSLEKSEYADRMWPSLNVLETQSFVNLGLCSRYRDTAVERFELEAQVEGKRFDRLHSVLYGELSAESKKLRALVRISEAKLALHKEKQSSLQELMDAIESHRQPATPSFPDDVI